MYCTGEARRFPGRRGALLGAYEAEWSETSCAGDVLFFFFQAEDGIRDLTVTGVQTCALPISLTVRDWREGARRPVPRGDWHIQDRTRVVMPAGFEMGKIYELVYTAQDPVQIGRASCRERV